MHFLIYLFKVQDIFASQDLWHAEHTDTHLTFTFVLAAQRAVVALQVFMICTWCCVCNITCVCMCVRVCVSERERVSVFCGFLFILIETLRFSEAERRFISQNQRPGRRLRDSFIDIRWQSSRLCVSIASWIGSRPGADLDSEVTCLDCEDTLKQ